MHIKPFKAVFPKVDLITSPSSFFSSIKYQYREYRASGVYNTWKDEAYYLYHIETEFGNHTGIVCATSVDDFNQKNVLPHEDTLAGKEQQMMHLLLKRKALVKPVLLGYHPKDNLHSVLVKEFANIKPIVDIVFENDEEHHRIWVVNDKRLKKKIEDSLNPLEKAYIGDGHHRSTTVSLLNASKELGEEARKYKYLLTAYFPFDQLRIWDYNRVFDISEIMSSSRFMAALSKYFVIRPIKAAAKPGKKHELCFLIDDQWYRMRWRKKYITKEEPGTVLLDSALVNKYIFQKILGIEDVRSDTRIKYYGGIVPMEKIIRQVKKFGLGIGLCIYPVSIDELTTMADQNLTLPPKSTFFLPRLKSGIVAKDL